MEKGGVGLVFVNDDSGSMFLHIARVVPDGPADMSGMLAPGDRLVAIDGIEIGSVAPGESPQDNGHVFYEGCEVFSFNVNLRRSRYFFPDKLTKRTDDMLPSHMHLSPPPPQSVTRNDFDDFAKFASASGTRSTYGSAAPLVGNGHDAFNFDNQNSQLVDAILLSLTSPPTVTATPYAPVPVNARFEEQRAEAEYMSQQLAAANQRIRQLEDQVVLAQADTDSTRLRAESQEQSLRRLVEQQQKSSQLTNELREFIQSQSEEISRLKEAKSQTREMDERAFGALQEQQEQLRSLTASSEAQLRSLTAELTGAREDLEEVRRERDLLSTSERALQDASKKQAAELQRAERALQDASKKQAATEQKVLELEKKVEKSVAPTEALKQSQESQEREESMKKKAGALAQEIVRLRAELKRGGGASEGGTPSNEENTNEPPRKLPQKQHQLYLEQISKLKKENQELRDRMQALDENYVKSLHENQELRSRVQAVDASNIGLDATPVGAAVPQELLSRMAQLEAYTEARVSQLETFTLSVLAPGADASPLIKSEKRHAVRSAAPATQSQQHIPDLHPVIEFSGVATRPPVATKFLIDLDIPFSEAQSDMFAFHIQLKSDIAQAISGDVSKIKVLNIQVAYTERVLYEKTRIESSGQGSLTASIELEPGVCSGGQSPWDAVGSLQAQYLDAHSPLRKGVLTSFATAVRDIEIVSVTIHSQEVMLKVTVIKGRNIPASTGDDTASSFVVVRTNNTDLGISEPQVGAEPEFLHDFTGRVLPDLNTMISISLHQQSRSGRDVLVGYIAVPLMRIIESGMEEGWYDVRSQDSGLVHGIHGIAEMLIRMSAHRVNGSEPHTSPKTNIVMPLASPSVLSPIVKAKEETPHSSFHEESYWDIKSAPQSPEKMSAITIEKPDYVLEIYIFKGRNIPRLDRPMKTLVTVQFGSQTYTTMSSWPTSAPVWNESLQLVNKGPPADLVTLMFWGLPVNAQEGNERVFLGHIAVPSSRVLKVQREEGWYDLRDKTGKIVSGYDDESKQEEQASALVSFSLTPAVDHAVNVQGFLISKTDDEQDIFEKRYHVLQPYTQELIIYSRLPLAGMTPGVIHTAFNIRECKVELDNMPQSLAMLKKPSCSFVVKGIQGRLLCSAEDAETRTMWATAITDVGNGPDMRKYNVSLRTTLADMATTTTDMPNTTTKMSTTNMQVVIGRFTIKVMERVRHLPSSRPGSVGYLCVVQIRETKTQTEEGWYEVREKNGSLVMGSEGKTSVLIRMRYF